MAIIKSRSAQSALLLRVSDRNIPGGGGRGVTGSIIDYTTVRLAESYSISASERDKGRGSEMSVGKFRPRLHPRTCAGRVGAVR